LSQIKESVRNAYGEALVELGKTNPAVVVLSADVSASTRSILFKAAFPERFFNLGVAEGNMTAVAAGLAACGKIPFVDTFAVFATLRAGDPLRSLIAYGNLNVKIAAGYSGVSDSYDGASHQSVEDLALVRALPNFTVMVVADAHEARWAVPVAASLKGPVYIRLSRAEVPLLSQEPRPLVLGRAYLWRPGADLSIVATGYMVHRALAAAEILAGQGIAARVIEIHTLKPLDTETLLRAARETGIVLTVEEHSIYGGLGSAVAEALATRGALVPMRIMGFPDRFGESGGYDEVLDKMGLGVEHIVENALGLLKEKNRSKEKIGG